MRLFCLMAAYLLICLTTTADAYLDPGTGSYVLQMVIAGIVSGLFAIKVFWRKIIDIFSNLFKRKR